MESNAAANMVAALKSNLARPLLQRQQQDARNTTMNKVKQLYLEHRYKQCAALCEETLKEDTSEWHLLHKTFLYFFAAVSYESLGQAAHPCSSNKLPFLNLAQLAFASAKNTLPLPYLSDENGSCDNPEISPALTDYASSTSVDAKQSAPSTPPYESPTPSPPGGICTSRSTPFGNYSHQDNIPTFDDYSPTQSLQYVSCWSTTDEFDLGGKSSQELRLRLKLDTPERHSDLAPKPLFIRKRSTILDSPMPQRPILPIPTRSALRSTPRQTALRVSPLIHHYEFLSTSQDRSLLDSSSHASTDSSLLLARYNANLSSFRTQLAAHLAYVSDTVTKTTMLQQEHKAKQSKRLASYWMLKPAAEGSEEVDRKRAERKERMDRLRQVGWKVNKERFGWKGEEYYRELRRRVEFELGG